MFTDISSVEGIGEKNTKKLQYAGVTSTFEFMGLTKTSEDREKLSRLTGIPQGHIENWSCMIDLSRVDGVGFQFAELLTFSGVTSVDDLRKRNAKSLHKIMNDVNEQKKLTRIVPSTEMVEKFIDHSRKITNIIN